MSFSFFCSALHRKLLRASPEQRQQLLQLSPSPVRLSSCVALLAVPLSRPHRKLIKPFSMKSSKMRGKYLNWNRNCVKPSRAHMKNPRHVRARKRADSRLELVAVPLPIPILQAECTISFVSSSCGKCHVSPYSLQRDNKHTTKRENCRRLFRAIAVQYKK